MHISTLVGALAIAASASAATAAQPVTGNWVTDDGKAIVTIAPCGKAICGHVTRILAAAPKGPLTDIYNPDPALRKRPILGLPILTDFSADGDAWKGRIYSPEEGKTYRSVIRREGPNALLVKGCVLFFCKSQTWKRAG